MQVLNRCRDSRNDHMQTRTRLRSRGDVRQSTTRGEGSNEIEDIDMSEVLEHLEDIDCMSSRRAVEATREAQLCLNELTHTGFFNKVGTSQAGESGTRSATFAQADDESLEDEWRNAYENRKTAWKLEASQSKLDCVVNTTSITNAADIERMAVDIPLVNNLFVDASVGTGDVVDNVGQPGHSTVNNGVCLKL